MPVAKGTTVKTAFPTVSGNEENEERNNSESFMKDARGHVRIDAQANGPIPKPVPFSYIWGDALEEWDQIQPDLRIINLETAVATSDKFWPGKDINYRMHPNNIPCLSRGKIDFSSLANNHTLDWGYSGLLETMESLGRAHIGFACSRHPDWMRAGFGIL